MCSNGSCLQIKEGAECIVEERFYSKKNEVYKVRCLDETIGDSNTVVIKKYLQAPLNRTREIELLQYLKNKGLTVPKIYLEKENYIIMEYIEGKTILEIIEEREKNNPIETSNDYRSNKKLIVKLIEWLKKFYRYTEGKYILRDINLRNFIISNNGIIYGFDFEDYDAGKIEEDVGKLCAYILTYDPPFTPWKLQFTKEFFDLCCKELKINQQVLLNKVEREIDLINKNRGKNYSMELFKN